MARFSMRRPDTQATVSMILSLSALFFMVGLAVLTVFRHFDTENMIMWYARRGMRFPAILACTAIALLLGALGSGFGLNSAGARRNDRNGQSWLGFFAGAVAITGTIILFAMFMILKQDIAA